MKKISDKKVRSIKKKLGVNVNLKTLKKGINVELEHGSGDKRTNVINNNELLAAKIALAHLVEYPDYYKRLSKMEKQAEKYWKNKTKKDPFVKKKSIKKPKKN